MRRSLMFLSACWLLLAVAAAAAAEEESPWFPRWEFGGHARVYGQAAFPKTDSLYEPVGLRTQLDGFAELRLKGDVFFGQHITFQAHAESVLAGGDGRRKRTELGRRLPGLTNLAGGTVSDDRRLVDLTWIVDRGDDYVFYNRLDRLNLTYTADWGGVTLGRQALTWGNGLIFNVMDLFNPFAPTDINRDYKIGDDMALVRVAAGGLDELQVLFVPRRDPENNEEFRFDASSLAAKYHLAAGPTEFDIMAARHYEDMVLGAGVRGHLGGTAYRLDATWTFLHDHPDRSGFFAFTANMDYGWVWLERNWYGLVEFYYNGLGDSDYREALNDPALTGRLARGELFTLGRSYLAAQVQCELHPLVNAYLGAILNLQDPSGVLQPRLTWDVTQNLQAIFGGNIYFGGDGSEFGGYRLTPLPYRAAPLDAAYVWLTYYF